MYYNIETKQASDALPRVLTIGGETFLNPALELCAKVGWRKMDASAQAPKGAIITSVAYVQSKTDPLVAEAKLTYKTAEEVAVEKDAHDKAMEAALADRNAKISAERAEITKAFADEKQAEAIGKLFDRMARGILW